MKVQQHFVTFYSPGTLMSETSTYPIDSWDIETAVKMSKNIKERHGAKPYGFVFSTKAREDHELNSKEVKRSGTYYLSGRVLTLKQVMAEMPNERILISNMRINNINKVIINNNSYCSTLPFHENDVVITDLDKY